MNGNPFYEPYWDTELEHHGVKGMKHGVKHGPPYPLDRGKDGKVTKTQKKKKQSFLQRIGLQKKSKSKSSSSKSSKTKEEKKQEITAKEKEKLREELLKSTDAKFIAKHADLLDTKELKDRIDRINTETSLKKLAEDPKKKSNVDKGMEWINNISKIADTTSKVANAYSAVYDASSKRRKDEEARADKAQERRDKLKSRAQERKDKQEQERKNTEALSKFRGELPDQILKGLGTYGEAKETYEGLKIDFDSKTGKLTFSYQDEKKESKKKDKKKKK